MLVIKALGLRDYGVKNWTRFVLLWGGLQVNFMTYFLCCRILLLKETPGMSLVGSSLWTTFTTSSLRLIVDRYVFQSFLDDKSTLWNKLVPRKINVFVWSALHNKLLVFQSSISVEGILTPPLHLPHQFFTLSLSLSLSSAISPIWNPCSTYHSTPPPHWPFKKRKKDERERQKREKNTKKELPPRGG